MLPNVLGPSPIYHSSVFKNAVDSQNPSVGSYFMENLLRLNSGDEQGLHLISSSGVVKSEHEYETPSNGLREKVKQQNNNNNAIPFLGPPSASSSSGTGRFFW